MKPVTPSNVLATITGEVDYVDTTGLGGWQFTRPQIHTVQDYYAFGMLKPDRTISTGEYRFGFNGKENDNEVKGMGNHQDYGMRVYDTRLGRFLSIDPLAKDYPWYTPYQFAGNKPIWASDLDGKEEFLRTTVTSASGTVIGTVVKIVSATGMDQDGNGTLDVQIVHEQVVTLGPTGVPSAPRYVGTRLGSYATGNNAFGSNVEQASITRRLPNGQPINYNLPVPRNINIVNLRTGTVSVGVATSMQFPIRNGPVGVDNVTQKQEYYDASNRLLRSDNTTKNLFYFLGDPRTGNDTYQSGSTPLLPVDPSKSAVPQDPTQRNLIPGSDAPPVNPAGNPILGSDFEPDK